MVAKKQSVSTATTCPPPIGYYFHNNIQNMQGVIGKRLGQNPSPNSKAGEILQSVKFHQLSVLD